MMKKLAAVDIGSEFDSPFGGPGQIPKMNAATGVGIGDLVSLIITASITLAGVAVLFMIVVAGFQMISSAGSGNKEGAAKAKQAASSAGIGFVIVFTAYWVIRIIEVITGSDFITVPGI